MAAVAGLEAFYKGLKADDLAAKIETARGLGRSGSRPAREALLRILAGETDPKAREEIAQILVAAGIRQEDLAGLERKEKELLEKDVQAKQIQRSRIETLDRLDPKNDASLPELRKTALEETTIGIATIGFRKLEARGDAAAVEILALRARAKPQTSADKIIQTNALASLSRMKVVAARTTIREIVLSEDPELRRQAITLVGAFGDEAMLPLLEQAARTDASPETRRLVDEAMLGIRSRTASKGSSSKEGS